ncbi:MAG: hypothetical protein ACRDRN_02590 [Sciscionella sp.]
MLYIVLVLVIVALGLLIAALVVSATLYAWVSLGFSVLAGVVLIVDWAQRRNRDKSGESTPAEGSADASEHAGDGPEAAPQTAAETSVAPGGAPTTNADPEPSDTDPDEEDTDAADLLVISELDAEVRVLDEHPRYHRSRCRWLAGRPTLAVRVKEARELGFTPCAVCMPDAKLAAAQRARHGAGRK